MPTVPDAGARHVASVLASAVWYENSNQSRKIPRQPYGAYWRLSSTTEGINKSQALVGDRKQRETVRILIADDFAEWRTRIRSLLETRQEWSVISEACDGAEAVQKTAELRPDIVILDIAMPRLNGIDAAKIIRYRSPTARVIFVSQIGDAEFRNATLAAVGAAGYVLKARAASELQRAVEHALRVVTVPTQRPAVRPENLSS